MKLNHNKLEKKKKKTHVKSSMSTGFNQVASTSSEEILATACTYKAGC